MKTEAERILDAVDNHDNFMAFIFVGVFVAIIFGVGCSDSLPTLHDKRSDELEKRVVALESEVQTIQEWIKAHPPQLPPAQSEAEQTGQDIGRAVGEIGDLIRGIGD